MKLIKGFQREGDIVEVPEEVKRFVVTQPGLLKSLYGWILFKGGKLPKRELWEYENCSADAMLEGHAEDWAASIELMLMQHNNVMQRLHTYERACYDAEKKNE